MEEGKLNPDKAKVLLVNSSLVLGSNCIQMPAGVAFASKVSICGLGVLLDPGLLLEVQVAALARMLFITSFDTPTGEGGPCPGRVPTRFTAMHLPGVAFEDYLAVATCPECLNSNAVWPY